MRLSAKIKQKSNADCITAAGALVNALNQLAVTRFAFASPYMAALNDDAIGFLDSHEIATVSRFEHPRNDGQGELQTEQIMGLTL